MTTYLVAEIDIKDREAMTPYISGVNATLKPYGGRFLARGGDTQSLEGEPNLSNVVIVEFPTMAAMNDWYNSASYQEILGNRLEHSTGRVFCVEGVPAKS
jgi:uncharacterized protein (DUF1330 family)